MIHKLKKFFNKLDKQIGVKKGRSIAMFIWTGVVANVGTYVSGNYFDGKLIEWFNLGIVYYDKLVIEMFNITQSNVTSVLGFVANFLIYGLIGLGVFQIFAMIKKVMK